jgi:GT2 family glycosyltransferase
MAEGRSDVATPACLAIVVTYNSADDVGALLDDLARAAERTRVRTVVVDNGSTDGTAEVVAGRTDVELVRAGANVGYAGGINVGRRLRRSEESVLVLNPDLRLHPGAVDELVDALGDPGVGIAVPRLVDGRGRTLRSLRRDPSIGRALGDAVFGGHLPGRPGWLGEQVNDGGVYEHEGDVDWATGAALLLSADCDRRVGDWDEDFFMYSEEVDVAIRARRAGFRIRFVPTAVARHEEGGSGRSPDLAALMVLNRVRLFAKHHGRLASAAYRLVVAVHEAARFWSRDRRGNAKVALGLSPPPQFPAAPPVTAVPW